MSNPVFANIANQSQAALAPVVKANKLAVANLEKLTALQLAAVQSYVDVGLGRLKAATEVNNLQDLQAFYAGQIEAANGLRQKLLDDNKALVELGSRVKAELAELAKESVAELTKAAA